MDLGLCNLTIHIFLLSFLLYQKLNYYYFATLALCLESFAVSRDVNKDLTPKDQDKDKDLTPKDQDKDKDLTPKDKDKDLTPKDQDKDLLDLTPKDKDKDKDL